MPFDIARWLTDIGLPRYTKLFEAQGFEAI
jgi:SAM domain (Sterile alpha motif)